MAKTKRRPFNTRTTGKKKSVAQNKATPTAKPGTKGKMTIHVKVMDIHALQKRLKEFDERLTDLETRAESLRLESRV